MADFFRPSRLLVQSLLCLFFLSAASARTPVWIDADPALGLFLHDADDGFVLAAALLSPRIEIRGISITAGNTSIARGKRITRELLSTVPRPHPPVFSGTSTRGKSPSPAVLQLHRALQKERLTILALGPLTNLADLLHFYPKDARRIQRIICLAGELPDANFRVPGWIPYRFHDTNFIKNPKAAAAVAESCVRIDFVPFDLGKRLTLRRTDFQQLRHGQPSARHLHRRARLWWCAWRFFGAPEAPVFDALVLVAAEDASLLTFRPASIQLSSRRLFLTKQKATARHRVAVDFSPQARTFFLRNLLPAL